MKAVIWTDLFQASIMIISVLLIVIKGILDAGGFARFG
jgi:Na+/proline symporter